MISAIRMSFWFRTLRVPVRPIITSCWSGRMWEAEVVQRAAGTRTWMVWPPGAARTEEGSTGCLAEPPDSGTRLADTPRRLGDSCCLKRHGQSVGRQTKLTRRARTRRGLLLVRGLLLIRRLALVASLLQRDGALLPICWLLLWPVTRIWLSGVRLLERARPTFAHHRSDTQHDEGDCDSVARGQHSSPAEIPPRLPHAPASATPTPIPILTP